MALAFAPVVLGLSLLFGAGRAAAEAIPPSPAQGTGQPSTVAGSGPDAVDTSLSPECRVPGSKLYTIASLRAVKNALREQRAVKVLAIGSPSTAGIGSTSAQASYPMRLEDELEKNLPGVDVEVENRGMPGEIAAAAADRIRNTIAEVEPDLVIWQVGSNDALARVDLEAFAQALGDTVKWVKSHGIDVVLIDPQYTKSLEGDEYYQGIVKAIQDVAQRDRVPLVQRYAAMRFLAGQKKGSLSALKDQFRLSDLGHRCMAEHVARAISMSLLAPEPPSASVQPRESDGASSSPAPAE